MVSTLGCQGWSFLRHPKKPNSSLNRWATEAQREEVASPSHIVSLLILPHNIFFSRMFALILGSLVLKFIFIPPLKQLSFNIPKADHYPPKV